MGLFNRSAAATVTVSPAVVTPRQGVSATATTGKPIDKVTSATLEWGYTNFYRYHWAGRAESVAAAGNDTVWTAGQVGTNYGGDRDTDDWVGITKVDLPIANSQFTGGSSNFCVPSWAPGSSPQIARWACRLTIERDGRDVDTRGEFTVVIGTADVTAAQSPTEQVCGAAETTIELQLPSPVYRAGDTINGHVILTPHLDLPDGELGVCWMRELDSHPLERTPSPLVELNGPIVKLSKRIPLRANAPTTLPFALPLPPDAAPTASAVHSSLRWSVQARMFYAGFTGHLMEKVRRPILVVNAP